MHAGRRDRSASPENLKYAHSEDNEITLESYEDIDEDTDELNFTSVGSSKTRKTYNDLSDAEKAKLAEEAAAKKQKKFAFGKAKKSEEAAEPAKEEAASEETK